MTALRNPTLVLNKSWQAINVLRVMDALTKVWLQKARVVDPADYQMYEWEDWTEMRPEKEESRIKLLDFDIKVPEVIVLTEFNKLLNVGVTFNRRNIYIRDKFTCQYCRKKLTNEELTLDHVVPRSKGGQSSFENCVVACFPCNSKKADRDLVNSGMVLLRKPAKPRWAPSYRKGVVLGSWEKFVSDMYWNIPLDQ